MRPPSQGRRVTCTYSGGGSIVLDRDIIGNEYRFGPLNLTFSMRLSLPSALIVINYNGSRLQLHNRVLSEGQ